MSLRMRTAALQMIAAARARATFRSSSPARMQPITLPSTSGRRRPDGIARREGEVTLKEVVGPSGLVRHVSGEIRGVCFQRAARCAARGAGADSRSREPAASRVGSRGRRPLPRHLAQPARLSLDESGHDTRLPVQVQLVREADLRSAVYRPPARGGRRRDRLVEGHVPTRSPVGRRFLGPVPWISSDLPSSSWRATPSPFKCPCAPTGE